MKATEQYFPVVLFIMLYKVVLTFEPVDKILKCDHLDKSCSMNNKRKNNSFIINLKFDHLNISYWVAYTYADCLLISCKITFGI